MSTSGVTKVKKKARSDFSYNKKQIFSKIWKSSNIKIWKNGTSRLIWRLIFRNSKYFALLNILTKVKIRIDEVAKCAYSVQYLQCVKCIFPNSMEKWVLYLGYFSISFEKITFYTEILTRKVELWIFSLVSLMKKHHKTTFLVKISVLK